MSLEPTVFIDLGKLSSIPQKRLDVREDPLAPDIIKVKEEPVEDTDVEAPATLHPLHFVSSHVKLELINAAGCATGGELEDPLALDNTEIKMEIARDSVVSREAEDPLVLDCFISKTDDFETSGVAPTVMLGTQRSHEQEEDNSVISSVNVLSARVVVKQITGLGCSILKPVDLNHQNNHLNRLSPVDPVGHNDSFVNTVNSQLLNSEASPIQNNGVDNLGSTNIMRSNSSLSVSTNSANYNRDDLGGDKNSCPSSDSSQLSNVEVSNSQSNVETCHNKKKLNVTRSTAIKKKRKICLETQINYYKSSSSCRRSRNSLLTALDSNTETESFTEILEKLITQQEKVTCKIIKSSCLNSLKSSTSAALNELNCDNSGGGGGDHSLGDTNNSQILNVDASHIQNNVNLDGKLIEKLGCEAGEISSLNVKKVDNGNSQRVFDEETHVQNDLSSSRNVKKNTDSRTSGLKKRRKVCLETQINYNKSSGLYRKSRNSLLTALDSNIETESFNEILEKLITQQDKVTCKIMKSSGLNSQNNVTCTSLNNVRCDDSVGGDNSFANTNHSGASNVDASHIQKNLNSHGNLAHPSNGSKQYTDLSSQDAATDTNLDSGDDGDGGYCNSLTTANNSNDDDSQMSIVETSNIENDLDSSKCVKQLNNNQLNQVKKKKRRECLQTHISDFKLSGSSRRSRNSLSTALDNNSEKESFNEIFEELITQHAFPSNSAAKTRFKNNRKTLQRNHLKSSPTSDRDKKIIPSWVNNSLDLSALPIKNCSVVVERLNLTNLNSNEDLKPPFDQNQKQINKKSLLKEESKLVSLQLFKEMSKVNANKYPDVSKVNESSLLSTSSNFVKSQSQCNPVGDAISTTKKRYKPSKQQRSKYRLTKRLKSKTESKITKKAENEIKKCLRGKSKSINYNESCDEEDFENLIITLYEINDNMKSLKSDRNQEQTGSKLGNIQLDKGTESTAHQEGDEAGDVGKEKHRDDGGTKENVDQFKDSNCDGVERDRDSDTLYLDQELDDDIDDDNSDNDKNDPDWIVGDYGSLVEEEALESEALCSSGDIVEDKPIITIDSKTKNYGKHPVLKNQESIERIKDEVVKRQSKSHDIDPNEFVKMLQGLLNDSGIVKNNVREDNGLEIYNCEFCSYSSKSEVRLMKHLSMHFSNIKRYNCQYCQYSSSSPYYMSRHKNSVHGIDLTFRCKVCDWITNCKDDLTEHKKQFHDDPKPFNCQDCSYKTNVKHRLIRHVNNVHSTDVIKPYSCNECGIKFICKSHLKRHLLSHSKETPYVCRLCGYTAKKRLNLKTNMLSSGKEDLVEHMHRAHSTNIYKCELCSYTSNENYLVQHHLKYTHNKVRRYSCSLCPYKAIYRGMVQVHTDTVHNGLKPFQCHICNKQLARKGDLDRHIMYIHDKSVMFNCQLCPYQTPRKQELQLHQIARHPTTDFAFKCHYCNFNAPIKRRIKNHILRMHNLKRPYFCIYCKFKCSSKDNLTEHMVKHEKGRPHKCTMCSYMAAHKTHLVQHIKGKHEKTKDFICFYCNWGTGRKEHMIRHITGKHDFINDPLGKTTFTYLSQINKRKKSPPFIRNKTLNNRNFPQINKISYENTMKAIDDNNIQQVIEITEKSVNNKLDTSDGRNAFKQVDLNVLERTSSVNNENLSNNCQNNIVCNGENDNIVTDDIC